MLIKIEYQEADSRSSDFSEAVTRKNERNKDKFVVQNIRIFDDSESIFGHSVEIFI